MRTATKASVTAGAAALAALAIFLPNAEHDAEVNRWSDPRIGQVRSDRDAALGTPRAMPLQHPTKNCNRDLNATFEVGTSGWYCDCPNVGGVVSASCFQRWSWLGQVPDVPCTRALSGQGKNGWACVRFRNSTAHSDYIWVGLRSDDPRSYVP